MNLKEQKLRKIISRIIKEENRVVTLYDFLQEMGTYFKTSQKDLDKAKKSNINTKNNAELKQLASDWMDGTYDEDPDQLYDSLLWLIPKNIKEQKLRKLIRKQILKEMDAELNK